MIADILFEVAWKSTVVAAAVVALLYAMRSQAPSNRVAVGGLGLGLLLALPAIVLTLALLPVPAIEMAAPAAPSAAAMPIALEPGAINVPFSAAPEAEAAPALVTPERLLLLWGAGVLFVLLRLAAGLATLWRWTERAELVASPQWRSIMRRCAVPDTTLLLVSDQVPAPLSWGWRMPVILINRDTLANASEAEAVIAHEAAHLSRGDWPRLIAARLVVAMLWFNPFVWLLERLYLQDVEEAADAEATRRVEPAHYAQALLNVARNVAVPAGANSIASGALSKRIRQVLHRGPRSRWERTWRIGALTSVAAVAAPVAAVQFVAPSVSAAAEIAPAVASAPVAPVAPVIAAVARPARVAPAAPVARPAMPAPTPAIAPIAAAAFAAQPSPAPAPREMIDEEALERALEAAEEARDQAAVAVRHVDHERIRAQVAASMASAREQMRRGADQMDQGAVQMRRGAAQMREEARKLRDSRYRAEQIAKARARGDGHVPTDQELIDAIPKMLAGADKMDAGVEKMRAGAARMRRQAQNQ